MTLPKEEEQKSKKSKAMSHTVNELNGNLKESFMTFFKKLNGKNFL